MDVKHERTGCTYALYRKSMKIGRGHSKIADFFSSGEIGEIITMKCQKLFIQCHLQYTFQHISYRWDMLL